jgi:hypothetical protein
MKIILADEEAHHYIDMRDDIIEYKRYIAELEALLNAIDSKEESVPLDDDQTHDYPADITIEEGISEEEKPLSTWTLSDWITYVATGEYPETRKGTAWVDGEDYIVRMAVGKAHDAFKITSIAKALGRTVGAINSRAIQSGFSVRKNRIVNL